MLNMTPPPGVPSPSSGPASRPRQRRRAGRQGPRDRAGRDRPDALGRAAGRPRPVHRAGVQEALSSALASGAPDGPRRHRSETSAEIVVVCVGTPIDDRRPRRRQRRRGGPGHAIGALQTRPIADFGGAEQEAGVPRSTIAPGRSRPLERGPAGRARRRWPSSGSTRPRRSAAIDVACRCARPDPRPARSRTRSGLGAPTSRYARCGGRRCYHRVPWRPSRYYLTTAIAYANNKPGLHTLYEVIGADAIARWHRMLGDDTRFLTGTDEHSVNIAQAAVDEGRPTREFVDEKVALFKAAEDALGSAPTGSSGRPTPTTSGPPRRWSGAPTPTATSTSARTRAGTARTRASQRRPTSSRRARDDLPEPPRRPAAVADRAQLVLPPVGLPGALERYFAEHPDFVQPDYRRNEMLGFIRGGLEDFSISRERTPGDWGIPFPIAENGETAQREDGIVGPRGGQDLRLVRRAHQLHHRRRLPGRPGGVRALVAGRPPRHRQGHRPVPHDLLAGDAVERRASRRRGTSGSTAGCSRPAASG